MHVIWAGVVKGCFVLKGGSRGQKQTEALELQDEESAGKMWGHSLSSRSSFGTFTLHTKMAVFISHNSAYRIQSISGDTSYRYNRHSGFLCWNAHFRSGPYPAMRGMQSLYLAEDSKHSMNFWYRYTEGRVYHLKKFFTVLFHVINSC